MTCPKCGMDRALADRVCRRCKYLFDEDRFIGVEPPRASGVGALPRPVPERRPLAPWVVWISSLVPGLGHVLSGNPRRGLVFFGIVAGLAGLSVLLFTSVWGRILFGLAISAHAYSIFDMTPLRRIPEVVPRAAGMAGILAVLFLVYWPALAWLANRYVAPLAVQQDRAFGGVTPPDVSMAIFMLFLFAASVFVSVWIGRRLSARKD